MSHLSQEQIVEVYYGERGREHLAECAACKASFDQLTSVLEMAGEFEAPERGEGYGREVWARVAPRLERQPRFAWAPRRWAMAGLVAALVLVAFFAGRFSTRGPELARTPAPAQPQARERVLVVAVEDHLARSQMVLLELMNAAPARQMDIAEEQSRADDLVSANRLYRQAAMGAGDEALAVVLDDLERALLEIARSAPLLSSSEFEKLRQRIEDQGIVFKVRVIDSGLRTRSTSL